MPERVRIEAPDAESATVLLYRLRHFDCRLVPRDPGAFDVSVESAVAGRELNRLIDEVLETVERWLGDNRVDAVTVHVEGEAYSMRRARLAEQVG